MFDIDSDGLNRLCGKINMQGTQELTLRPRLLLNFSSMMVGLLSSVVVQRFISFPPGFQVTEIRRLLRFARNDVPKGTARSATVIARRPKADEAIPNPG